MYTEVVRTCTACRLCGEAAFEPVISFGDTPLANNYLLPQETEKGEPFAPLSVIQCKTCFSVQLEHTVDPRVLFEHYLYVSGTSPIFRKHFDDYAAHVIEKLALATGSFVIDIGSNDGVLLSSFKARGHTVLGIEPAKGIAHGAQAAGIETVNAFLSPVSAERIRTERGEAHIVTANNVFAHVDDARSFALAVRSLLADDGAYVFEVQYLKDLVEKNLFDLIYHEHIFYHHLDPLVRFFTSIDMEIFDVERVATHGGSLRVYVQKRGARHSVDPAVTALCAEESFLNTSKTYTAFRNAIQGNKRTLAELLAGIAKQGKRVAGYGAPAKGTTFCYAFNITGKTLEFIVDDSPLKQGRIMPGTHIPIVSREHLFARKPDYCLVLAWNFAEPIMRDANRFTEVGGRFINPVPKPYIV